MAFNKQRTSTTTKVLIVVLIVALVGGVLLAGSGGLIGLFSGSGVPAPTQTNQTAAGGQVTYDSIAQGYQPTIVAAQTTLKKNPKDFATLKTLGDTYFDWALKVGQTPSLRGADKPLWTQASKYYVAALAAKPVFNPAVQTDLSITYFSAGNTPLAIKTVRVVLDKQPDFAQANLNAGIFYESAGDKANALKYLEKYVSLNPSGEAQALQVARDKIAALKK